MIIPTTDAAFYDLLVTLDGVAYRLSFAFNQTVSAWYLTVSTAEDEVIVAGVKLIVAWDLLRKVADPRKPPGALLVGSNTTDLSPPGLEDLAPSGRCYLDYLTAAQLVGVPRLQ